MKDFETLSVIHAGSLSKSKGALTGKDTEDTKLRVGLYAAELYPLNS